MGYLIEAVQKDYEPKDENRLSQVFSATFNNSEKFRKLFLKFIEYPIANNLRSLTQKSFKINGKDARIDLCIVDAKDKPLIIVENKIESHLGLNQLKKYNRIKQLVKTKKVALVKHHFAPFADNLGWKICHWTDLHGYFSKFVKTIGRQPIDKFIIENFLDYLEELRMSQVRIIKGDDLKELAKAIHKIRNANAPYYHLYRPVFQVANDYVNMLGQIVNLARQEEIITKRIRSNFRFSPWIGNWWEANDQKKGNVFIGIEIRLSRKFKDIFSIGTGLHLNDQLEQYCAVTTYTFSRDNTYLHETEYKAKNLVFEKYADQVINSWKKWLK
jgi:hypothetical protein